MSPSNREPADPPNERIPPIYKLGVSGAPENEVDELDFNVPLTYKFIPDPPLKVAITWWKIPLACPVELGYEPVEASLIWNPIPSVPYL